MRALIHGIRRRQMQIRPRSGTILVITAIVMIALVGMLGLVIDAGQLMTAHRKTQNAADAAATAAAMDMFAGASNGTATTTAVTFVQNYNGLPTATVVVNIPPASGPHAGNSRFVEVIVTNPFTVRFIQVVGISPSQTVTARAVAGCEGVAVTAGVIALDRNARPGVNLTGNGTLKVNGTILVNSDGGGLAADGSPINNGNTGSAIVTSGNGTLHALDVQSVGGVSNISKIKNYNTSISQSPLHTGTVIQSDPYQMLPAPTTANGAIATNSLATPPSHCRRVFIHRWICQRTLMCS
jgi:Flp pilus assembly protein TadG